MPAHSDHVVADQSEALAFLSDPRSYPARRVERIDTHGAVVFLAGDDAYKVKRAVRFPFMDFSTLDKRRAACEAEVEVNRASAPMVYLGVVPLTRSAGGLALGGSGEVVEWTVHMRRFDETATLDRKAAAGALSTELIAKLARAVLASHAAAPLRDGAAATQSLARYVEENRIAFLDSPRVFPRERVADITRRSANLLAGQRELLAARGREGYVRRCHGDLHLRNIALIDGEPILFDAVEFDDAIATGDVLYDLAFLLMDVAERGLRGEANLIFNRYLWETDEAHLSGLAAMPLFLSLRAAIRAKVIAAALQHLNAGKRDEAAAEARRYFDFAECALHPAPARLVAVGGLSGTGKSTLAAGLAGFLGRPPGAVHLRSDIERKHLFAVAETDRLPAAAYATEVHARVYATLERKAGLALGAGHAVIVDAVHARPEERHAIEAVAQRAGIPFTGIWLEAPVDVLIDRVTARCGDASDANAEVVRLQTGYELGPLRSWTRLPAAGAPEDVLAAALDLV